MLKDNFDFLLRFDIHIKIVVRPDFGMPSLDILSDHYERH